MTGPVLQPTGTPSPMRPRCESLAAALIHCGARTVPPTAKLFRAGERILVGGGGVLVDIAVDRPPETWQSRPILPGIFVPNPEAEWPLFVSESGSVLRLESDLSLREIHRAARSAGDVDAFPLHGGGVLVWTTRSLSGTYLLDSEGRTRWRVLCTDPVLAAFSDGLIAAGSGKPDLIVCRDMTTGEERWRWRGTRGGAARLIAIIHHTAWLSDGTALVAVGLADGKELASLDTGVLAPRPRLDPGGCAHLIVGRPAEHWLLDLHTGTVVSRRRFLGNSLSDPFTMEALTGGAVLVRDRAQKLYRLEGGDGDAPLPSALWEAPAIPLNAAVQCEGLVVLTEPHSGLAEPMRSVHSLAPAQ